MKVVIADSSTLIALLDACSFDVLFELFDEIKISDEVYDEITYQKQHGHPIERYLISKKITCISIDHDEFYEMLIKKLDKGESASIVLAKKLQLPLVIDEKKGRAIAKSLGIGIIGLVGIILKLLKEKIIDKNEAVILIQTIEKNNFRLSDELQSLVYDFKVK